MATLQTIKQQPSLGELVPFGLDSFELLASTKKILFLNKLVQSKQTSSTSKMATTTADNAENYQLDVDTGKMCRICLTENETQKNIFCNDIVDGTILPFPNVFRTVTQFKIEKGDKLPDKICVNCKAKMLEFYSFKQKCLASKKLLHNILNIVEVDEAEPKPIIQSKPPPIMVEKDTQTSTEMAAVKKELHFSNKSINTVTPIICDKGTNTIAQLSPTICDRGTNTVAQPTPTICDKETNTTNLSPTICSLRKDQTSGIICNKTDDMAETECDSSMELSTVCNELQTQSSLSNSSNKRSPSIDKRESASFKNEIIKNEFSETIVEDEKDDDLDDFNRRNIEDHLMNDDSEVVAMSICGEEEYMLSPTSSVDFEEYEEIDDDLVDVVEENFEEKFENAINSLESKGGKNEKNKLLNHCWCKLCKKRIKTEAYENHQVFHHLTLPVVLQSLLYFRCHNCCTVYHTPSELQNHFFNYKKCSVEKIACTDYQFLDDESEIPRFDLANLNQRVCSCFYEDEQDQYRCSSCLEGPAFKTIDELVEHCSNSHFECDKNLLDEMVHQCGYCSETFGSLSDIIRHVYFHIALFHCPFCDINFDEFILLNEHLYKEHLDQFTIQKPCKYCKESFASKTDYLYHLQHTCSAKSFKCTMCDKKFIKKNSLKIHMKYHMDDRKFECNYCEKKFVQMGDLTAHKRTHNGDRPFKCHKCDKSFRTSGNRQDHLATHETENRFSCDQCTLTFKSKRILSSHISQVHLKATCFTCAVCSKEFYRRYHLTIHMRTHNK